MQIAHGRDAPRAQAGPARDSTGLARIYAMEGWTSQEGVGNRSGQDYCALVLIDFLIHHGLIMPEEESGYIETLARLHRKLDFPIR